MQPEVTENVRNENGKWIHRRERALERVAVGYRCYKGEIGTNEGEILAGGGSVGNIMGEQGRRKYKH